VVNHHSTTTSHDPHIHQEDIKMNYGYEIRLANDSHKIIRSVFPMTKIQAAEALQRAVLYHTTTRPWAKIVKTKIIERK
jgi:hypothetical protein